MIQSFREHGYEIVDFEKKADIYIINTCTVTNMSDRKSRQILRQVKKCNPDSIVIAVGCYAQVSKNEIEKIEEIDLVLGTNEKVNIVEHLEIFLESKNYCINEENNQKDFFEQEYKFKCKVEDIMHKQKYLDYGSVTFTEKTRAVIKVQDGCDRFCSYCIIPFARGPIRSRDSESIIKEITQIAKKNIKEVVITGIHVASYGRDFKNGECLIDLLEKINKIKGIERIRLGSLEPIIMTEEFLIRLKKLDKICHHFHLSLQSGCTTVLERMNRKYTAEEFKEIVERIRKFYKDVIITTDIIVGFPGESEEEFTTTYEYLKKLKLYKLHVFKYSPRKGTKAEKMLNQVSGVKKEERSKKILQLSDQNENLIQKSYIGKTVEVLFEELDKETLYKGHTSNFIIVKVKSNTDISNKILKVKIKDIDSDKKELIGELCEF